MQQEKCAALPVEVQLVDNWHDQWPTVLALIERFEKKPCLQIDEDGWIAARQNLLVAFQARTPVGFICFRVEPTHGDGHVALAANVEACEVDRDADIDALQVSRTLRTAAMNRALELRCGKFLGKTCVDA
jgi:hypothetical protein